MAGKVIDKDMGYDAFVAKMAKASRRQPFVTVGVHSKDDSGRGEQVGNADVAAFNEFGTTTSPARPFLRPAIDENRAKYARIETAALGRWVDDKMSMKQALGLMGLAAKGDVQKKITRLKNPPNAPSTVEQKGSSNPLVDTGQMRAAIDFQVDDKGIP